MFRQFSKTPGLKVLEREHLDPILEEQKLSASGLVSPNSQVESGKIMEEDILVIIQLQEVTPEDPPGTHYYKILVGDKQTGELIDTGISYRLWMDKPYFDHFVKRAYAHVMKNYLM